MRGENCLGYVPLMSGDYDGIRTVEGASDASGVKICVVVSRFNELVTESLLHGAIGALRRAGADDDDLTIVRVPGAWELPGAAAQAAASGGFDAIVALGCLIRGDTLHYELIAGQTASELASLQTRAGMPVVLGVLTTDTLEQAMDRAGAKCGNKGAEAALTAVEMVSVYAQVGATSAKTKRVRRAKK